MGFSLRSFLNKGNAYHSTVAQKFSRIHPRARQLSSAKADKSSEKMKNAILDIFSTRSIGRDILLGLMPIVVIVALGVGSINFLIITKREARILQEEADQIAENLARIAAQSNYHANHNMTALTQHEYQKGLNVVSISIFDEIQNIEFVGSEIQGRHIIAKKPIMLFETRLGSVEVALSMNRILER